MHYTIIKLDMNKPLIMRIMILVLAEIGMCQLSFAQNDSDYTSRVPKYSFANTLKEQEEELKTNPLMLRFIKSRKQLEADKFRPIYHFVSPESTMNDPNGLCYWNGNWH